MKGFVKFDPKLDTILKLCEMFCLKLKFKLNTILSFNIIYFHLQALYIGITVIVTRTTHRPNNESLLYECVVCTRYIMDNHKLFTLYCSYILRYNFNIPY